MRVPHIALHSVRPSVCLSVRPVPGSTFVIILADVRYLLLLFTFAAPHTVSAISRTSLFITDSVCQLIKRYLFLVSVSVAFLFPLITS